ncbi:Protein of unknown function, putative, partial [Plasmodium vivax]
FPKSIEKIYEHEKILKINFTRLLARHEQNREFEHTRLREKLSDRSPYKNARNAYNNISSYSQVKRKASNNIDVYMKNYKHRYGKKKGLSKLDCYYENKVFIKFNNICDIGKKMQYDEKRSTRFFLKKYGIGLILFAVIPLFGLIYSILFGPGGKLPGVLGLCKEEHFKNVEKLEHKTDGGEDITNCTTKWLYEKKDIIHNIGYVNWAFSVIMVTIVLLVFIYIIAKVIKYERIKSGKGKMNRKEYIKYCKEVF